MKYNELDISKNKSRRRVGRGISAGQGKTAGRGTKGQGSRAGKKVGPTFSASHEHLLSGIPKKRGFRSIRVKAQTVYTGQLNDIKSTSIDADKLFEAGIVATPYHTIKLIVGGEYNGKATVKLQAASVGAINMLEKAGGKFEAVDVAALPVSQNPKKVDKRQKAADKTAK